MSLVCQKQTSDSDFFYGLNTTGSAVIVAVNYDEYTVILGSKYCTEGVLCVDTLVI